MDLVERDEARLALERLSESERVVAVYGPPGVGKTSLVLEVFGEAGRLVPLVDLETADDVRGAVAQALRIEPGDSPLDVALARALDHFGGVLILDACDRAAPAIADLIVVWTDLRVVLTSRAMLTFGEPLSLGPLSPDGALELWRRACSRLGHRSDPELAREILLHLDGLPRAIEWTASRAALLGERACLERLGEQRDGESASALDGSLDLLDDELLDALERVASFARAVPVPRLEALGVTLESLDALRRRSLLRVEGDVDPPRVAAYRPVTTAVRARSIARGTWPALVRAHARSTLAGTQPERAELSVIVERREWLLPELALRAALRLLPIELAGGAALAAAERVRGLLALIEPGPLYDRAHLGLARSARRAGELQRAREHVDAAGEGVGALLERAHLDRQESHSEAAMRGYEAALERARAGGDAAALALALGEVGRMLQSAGRSREAQARHLEAIRLSRAAGDTQREALERSLYARAVHRAGSPAEAIPLHELALDLHVAMGHERLAAAERGHLAYCHHEIGEFDEAERLFRLSVTGLARVGDVVLESIERLLLARLLVDRGRMAEARVELSLAAADRLGMPRVELTSRFVAGLVEAFEGRVEQARDEWRAGVALGLHQEVGFEALLPIHLAWARHELGEPGSAIEPLEGAAPGFAAAHELLRANIEGRAFAVDLELEATSSDVRRARALTSKRRTFELSADGRFAWLADGTQVDLSRRNAPRRILCALADVRIERPGTSISRDELISAGWPGERIRHDAADKRLRTAIWTLRKAGLEALLLTRDDGYLLDPLVPIKRRG